MLESQASEYQFKDIKKHYPVIRQMAIKKVFVNMHRVLSLFHHGLFCDEKDANEVKTPYQIFSWSKEDFEARLKLRNMAWLDVFIMDLSKSCMKIRKLQIDIKELLEITKLLCENFECQNAKVAEKLQSTLKLMELPEDIRAEFDMNVKKEEVLNTRSNVKVFKKNLLLQSAKKINALELILSENIVYEPIQTRYQVRYYNSLVEQFEDRNLVEQNKIRKEIERYTELMRIEKYCSQCTVNALYAEINKYRTRFDALGVQYTKKYEAINSKNAYKRAYFEKMRVQRSYLEEEILRFRDEIANVQRLNELQTVKRLQSQKQQGNTGSTLALGKKKKNRK